MRVAVASKNRVNFERLGCCGRRNEGQGFVGN
jgi:hypothetical protein